MRTPLEGIRVIEVGYFMAGPYAGSLLAALGAEVIKVEGPGTGDPSRVHAPFVGRDGIKSTPTSPEDLSLSILKRARNKKSITLNFKHPRGRQLLLDLVRRSDVLVENLRPGTMHKLGLDYDSVRAANPRIVYCSVSGFGQTGPRRNDLAFDQIIQAVSGLMSVTGHEGTPPVRAGLYAADETAPMFGALSILAALRFRDQTGMGQHIDVAMLDCLIALIWEEHYDWLMQSGTSLRQGNRNPLMGPMDCLPTQDGDVFLVCSTDVQWRHLAEAIGQPSLADEPRFATNKLRADHRDEIRDILLRWLQTRSTNEVLAIFSEHQVPCGPVLTIPDVLADAHVKHRGVIAPVPHPLLAEPTDALGPIFPVKFSESAIETRSAPILGQHNAEIYGELLGLAGDELEELRNEGVI